MAFAFRPVDNSFFDLFAELGTHLVRGAALLSEALGDGADREDVARRMRDAETAADNTTHELVRRANATFVTPFDREDIYALATQLDDVMDLIEEAVDMIALYEVKVLPSELTRQVEVHPALRRAHRRGDAAAAVDARPGRVLDRDQPAGAGR